MRTLLVGSFLTLLIPGISLPSDAQTVEVGLCNAGKVDVDVFLSISGKISTAHVGPADCASIEKTKGPMGAGYIGLAFNNSHGQWGAVHRLDLLPFWGPHPVPLPDGALGNA